MALSSRVVERPLYFETAHIPENLSAIAAQTLLFEIDRFL